MNSELAPTVRSRFASIFNRFVALAFARRQERRLRLCEMLSLGEKRFIAVVEYGREKFLVAGTPQTISLLKNFDGDGEKEAETQPSSINNRQRHEQKI